MKTNASRRGFLAKSALVLGAAAACELAGAVGAGKMACFGASASDAPGEETMPHVSVKLWPGRSEEEKQRLADAIVEDVVAVIGCGRASVSVSIEEISSGEWKEKVYEPDIQAKKQYLYKKPGYSM